MLPIEPQSPGLRDRIWWGSGSRPTAEWAGRTGLNMMSSTLLTEATGVPFHELQREQIEAYRAAYTEAGHTRPPRVSVSRSIFPIMNSKDAMYFGMRDGGDQIGVIDGFQSTFGKTYAAEPDELIELLKGDSAVVAADTVMLTIPNQLGVEYNLHILESFARHVAPELGWRPNTDGPVQADPIQAGPVQADPVS
jgi:alkanesulfonate monooxygenase SsuD/methylene tetrahydromethanopterin reductase-like flavin-dependent oxidoreductase (luciferase family)